MAPDTAPFVPPFPPRPARFVGPLRAIRDFRRNLLSVWPERAFDSNVMRLGFLRRRIVVCNSPDTVQEVLVDKHEIFQRKSPQHRHALAPLLGDGLFVSDGALWRERRRVVAPVTHVSRLAVLAPAIAEAAAERRRAWAALPPDRPFDLLAEMGHLTAEIICRTIFGRSLGAEAAATVVAAFAEYQAVVGQIDYASLLGLPDWFPRWRPPRLRAAVRRIHDVVDGLIAGILEAGEAGEASLIRSMAEAHLPGTGRPMDRQAFRNEAIVLFMAGHETTANALAWAFYILSQDRRSASRLHAELDAVLAGRDPGLDDVANLPFARAVVEETLRLYPPVPVLSREAGEATTIGGRPTPRGTLVIVAPWVLHRRAALWDQPDAFIPDRFLPGAPKPPRHGYIPFSTGPRICTGMHLGQVEAVICLAALFADADFELAQAEPVMPVARLTLRPGARLMMRRLPR
jgi:cytochrome P450